MSMVFVSKITSTIAERVLLALVTELEQSVARSALPIARLPRSPAELLCLRWDIGIL